LPVWRYDAKQATALPAIRDTQMSEFGTELARLMAARGLGVRELARMLPCNPGHISNLRSGKARPSPELAEALDEQLAAGGTLRALAPDRPPGRHQLTPSLDDSAIADEVAALDLVRQAEASLVGSGTVERLELAVDDLATAYPSTPSAVLLDRVRSYLSYVSRLLDVRTTLAEHRRLLVVGGGCPC
jgi:transcriptional regulator with XRE-family HTH domain